MLPGRGVESVVERKQVIAGNLKLLKENQIKTDKITGIAQKYFNEGCTVIYVCINRSLIGIIAMADVLRSNMSKVIACIMKTGVNPVLLTGDNQRVANSIAHQFQISDVVADCLHCNGWSWK